MQFIASDIISSQYQYQIKNNNIKIMPPSILQANTIAIDLSIKWAYTTWHQNEDLDSVRAISSERVLYSIFM